jgi:DNA-3-methyladenine glycosylase I
MDNTSSGPGAVARKQKLPERQMRSLPQAAPCWCPLQEGGVRTDDQHFETLTAAVFCARFKPDIVRSRWRAIRRCFAYFNLTVVASWPEHRIEWLMQQPGIIRNRKKIVATLRNAGELIRLRRRYGSVQAYLSPTQGHRSGLVQAVDRWAHYIGAPSIRCYLACAGLDPDKHKKKRYHRGSGQMKVYETSRA